MKGEQGMIPLIIPSYEPDERLLQLLNTLRDYPFGPVLLVNDGSGPVYQTFFDRAKELLQEKLILLSHEVNRGKGRALKTAFAYVLKHFPDAAGCVTADSDGQHSAAAIESIAQGLDKHPESLILGMRTFDGDDIPWKSRFGNTITMSVFSYIAGTKVHDTQTGLRGIPLGLMKEMLGVSYDRFEFEMQMLLDASANYPILELPIETIYDSKENHQTHFRTVSDSAKIYAILGKRFLKYSLASFSSSIIDLLLFTILCHFLRNRVAGYVALCTVLARIVSATYNYAVNYKVVFKSRENPCKAALEYALLAVVQMTMSALLCTGGVLLLPLLPEAVVKIVVDTVLFFASYYLQQKVVFRKS